MAAATNPTVTVQPLFSEMKTGTAGYKRNLQMIHVRCNADNGDTINLATYVPGLTTIVGILYLVDDGAQVGTAGMTFSTTTATITSGAAGVLDMGFIAY